MPEIPDVTVYVEAIAARAAGQPLERIRLGSPFVLRTYSPSARAFEGKKLTSVSRMGKRLVFAFEDDLFLVIHLMVAGRFRWGEKGAKLPGKLGLAALDFASGTLILTEAGTKKRASIHLVQGLAGVRALHAGGVELEDLDAASFLALLQRENHTLKRALTDPRILSGIGNAYSDEILWEARLSPVKLTARLTPEEGRTLLAACRTVLTRFTNLLRDQATRGFPEKVTAFRPEMAVHGRFGQECPRCGNKVQRIAYADNETNYCAACQTGGKLLADRALSRLLRKDWPGSLDEMEEMKAARRQE